MSIYCAINQGTLSLDQQREVLDYLIEEVVRQYPEQLQRFLVITSLLESFCAPLCDRLWGEGQSEALLEVLQRKHLCIVALDGNNGWYRYHHLFAEALRHRLRQSLPQEEIDVLYRKASAWYAEQGKSYEAMYYAVLGRDWPQVLKVLEHSFQPFYRQTGEVLGPEKLEKTEHPVLTTSPCPVSLLQCKRTHHDTEPSVKRFCSIFEPDEQSERKEPIYSEPLSAREQEVLVLLGQGASNQEIAQKLVIASNTTKRHVQAILAKLGVHNRTQAVLRAQQLNLLTRMEKDTQRIEHDKAANS
jgi:ATP/maltotriose-dependent transcriptional regulator MalT